MVNRDRFAKESVINKYNPLVAESSNKSRWYVAYQRNLTDFLKSQNPTDEYNTILPIGELYGRIREVSKSSDTEMWKYLILLECTLFQPYFPMSEADAKEKIFKGLQFDTETRKQSLFTIASYLGISLSYVARFEDSFKSNVKKMTGYWNKVLVGIGAGVAAALLAVVTAGGSIAAFLPEAGYMELLPSVPVWLHLEEVPLPQVDSEWQVAWLSSSEEEHCSVSEPEVA